jgi:hypothetical protein
MRSYRLFPSGSFLVKKVLVYWANAFVAQKETYNGGMATLYLHYLHQICIFKKPI